MSNGTPTDEEIKKRIKQVSRGMAAVAVLLIAMIVWSPVDEEFRKGAYRVFTLQPLGVDWKNVKVVQLKTTSWSTTRFRKKSTWRRWSKETRSREAHSLRASTASC